MIDLKMSYYFSSENTKQQSVESSNDVWESATDFGHSLWGFETDYNRGQHEACDVSGRTEAHDDVSNNNNNKNSNKTPADNNRTVTDR